MAGPTKIATCCHCGSKAALKLGKGRHELSCASCGAPLRQLKALPVKPAPRPAAISHQPALRDFAGQAQPQRKRRKKPKKKKIFGGKFKDFAEDLFDFVEDIFD
ncbi:hypothetical protein JQV27_01510 [Sulfitobacter mediterraneus]|jgi:hypothetical protein|uniref:hypothetical protein n=1 Tax=Sulfitobacter TaxID=60136 RepID=UPI0019334E0C|nr:MULTISPECIES: hypothetical protein [Sulfitobacter]MBM1631498.1 hypothetical protein [Sulfitobacter mediterraneus]MBM1639313.1 hypothetical protein [Sulfitobacter mediterraneus]MBM1643362.1 hypothetical protein [Sulfitobacter mediterraneus]MBM1647408.1 hypothetical protein [Sulfitobacter mediterraneus]MBM1651453.1 hypothetical protein [Sulfitobacter mediterraneus]